MAQLLEGVNALIVRSDNQDRDLRGIAKVDFPDIPNMAFGCEGRVVACLHIFGTDPDFEPQVVDRPVEQHVVIGHIEMTVIVDPLRFDLHDRGPERDGLLQQIVGWLSHR